MDGPNLLLRAVRDKRMKYAVYFDPEGRGPARVRAVRPPPRRRAEMAEQLAAVATECGTDLPA